MVCPTCFTSCLIVCPSCLETVYSKWHSTEEAKKYREEARRCRKSVEDSIEWLEDSDINDAR